MTTVAFLAILVAALAAGLWLLRRPTDTAPSRPPVEPPAPRAPTLRLQIEQPEAENPARTEVLERPVTRIGTDSRAAVRLAPHGVQRFHAVIEREGELFRLVDLGTREGTLLNGAPVHRAELGHRDVIQVGTARLVVELDRA